MVEALTPIFPKSIGPGEAMEAPTRPLASLPQLDDAIADLECGRAVGHDDDGFAQVAKTRKHSMLDVLVKRGGALVKQQHRSIAVDGARNGQSLHLPNG